MPFTCPTCRAQYASGPTCPADGTTLIATPNPGALHATMSAPPGFAPRVANPPVGIAAAIGVALVGAGAWAELANATHYRLSLIGVLIGLGVAFTFVHFGLKGQTFAIIAAAIALGGCALGDLGAGALIVSSAFGTGVGDVLSSVPLGTLMNINGLDALFYGIAGFTAFRRVATAR